LGKSEEGFSLISVHTLAFGKKQIDDRNWLSSVSLLSKDLQKLLSLSSIIDTFLLSQISPSNAFLLDMCF